MIPVEISLRARSLREAIGSADNVSRVMRGAYLASRGPSWSITGRVSSSNDFGASPLYFLRSGREHLQWAFIPKVDLRLAKLPNQRPPIMGVLLDRLSKKPIQGTPRYLLAEALGLFGAAGDEMQIQHEFLGLWQTLECLSMAKGGDTNRIATNIGNLWSNGAETIHYQLLAIGPIRNKLVHLGAYEVERQSATFLLGSLVRDVLVQYAQLTDKLTTNQHFLSLFSMMTLSADVLQARAEAIKRVRSMRKL